MQILTGHTKRLNDLAFSPDGTRLVSCSNDGTVRLWDTLAGEGDILFSPVGSIGPLRFAPDGNDVLVWQGSYVLERWSLKGKRIGKALLKSPVTGPIGLAVANSARQVVANAFARGGASVIHAWDTNTWKRRELYRTPDNYAFSGLAFDGTGTRLATTLGVFDVATGEQTVATRIFGNRLEWSPLAPVIAATGYKSPAINIHDAETGKLTATLKLDKKAVQDFAFSADGAFLAAVSNEETVRIWETRDWTERPGFAWGIGQLKCIAFSPDGMRAACGSSRGTILVWDWE